MNELIEFGIDALDRQPHDVEERAVDALDGGIADPLLNAVAAGLVQRMEVVHVIDDLLAG